MSRCFESPAKDECEEFDILTGSVTVMVKHTSLLIVLFRAPHCCNDPTAEVTFLHHIVMPLSSELKMGICFGRSINPFA